MALTLDHVIVRAAEPERVLAELQAAGFPVLASVEDVGGGLRSGIVRAGAVDIEVLAVGAGPPPAPVGFGLGFVADGEPLEAVARRLRAAGIPTSAVLPGRAGQGAARRTWAAIQLSGLLPEPFPVPFTRRPPGRAERLTGALLGALASVPAVARAASRRPGRSMVVVTRYDFDADAWRARVPAGPAITGVEVGVGTALAAWQRLGPLGGPPLDLRPDGPPGVRALRLSGAGWTPGRRLDLGELALTGA